MSDIIKRHATENFFDRTWPNFMELLERGAFSHTAFPGWLLIRSYCVTCNEPVTAIKYHGDRYELVPSGTEQMGTRWVIHQCPSGTLEKIWHEQGQPEYGEAEDIAGTARGQGRDLAGRSERERRRRQHSRRWLWRRVEGI
jgi:hypothetical protein